MGWIGNSPSQGLFNGGQIVDGTVDTVDIKDSAVTAQKLSSTAIKDKLASDQYLAVPRGTTAQRPTSPEVGYTRYNTDLGCLENYTVNGWTKVSILIPIINSITGNIYNTISSSLTLSGLYFGSSAGTVRFAVNGSSYDVSVTPTNDASVTVAVPVGVYNQTANSNVSVSFINYEGGVSAPFFKIVLGLPTGGTVTTSGNYRIHAFTSSDNLVIPSGVSITAETLIVAGGGGAGCSNGAAGGGAGGLIFNSALGITAGTYPVVVGAGGVGTTGQNSVGGPVGQSGSNSTFKGYSAIGGGGSASEQTQNSNGVSTGGGYGSAGGSGGGGVRGGIGGVGTNGQGHAGGANVNDGYPHYGGGGGGGAGQTGANGSASGAGTGGNGLYYSQFTSWGSPSGWFAGGGGGGNYNGSTPPYPGAAGGNGGGAYGGTDKTVAQRSAVANTGGGGGGAGLLSTTPQYGTGGSGGSGIVLVRYQLT